MSLGSSRVADAAHLCLQVRDPQPVCCAARLTCVRFRIVIANVSAFLECSNLDTSGKESVDKQDVATSLASQGVGTYDQVRETLKEVQVDAT
jgi:hypothetical protein